MNQRSKPPAALAPKVKLLRRREAAGNSKWSMLLDQIEGNNGQIVDDYLVLKPRHCAVGAPAGVCVLPIIEDANGKSRRILLLNTYRHPLEGYFWEGARGFIDAGEEPAAAALRELTEETGHGCSPDHLIPLGTLCQEPSTLACRVSLFAALRCYRTGPPVDDEPGLGALQAFDLKEAVAMASDGRIEEVCTGMALLRLAAQTDLI